MEITHETVIIGIGIGLFSVINYVTFQVHKRMEKLTKQEVFFVCSGAFFILFAHIVPLLSIHPFVFEMVYGTMMWYVAPPLLLLGWKKSLRRLYWHYKTRRYILFFTKPSTARGIFFSFFFMLAIVNPSSSMYPVIHAFLFFCAYLLWWNIIIPSIFTHQPREKHATIQVIYNFVITTCMIYLLLICKLPTIEKEQLNLGIYFLLSSQLIVHLIALASFLAKWSKREHVVDSINVAGMLGKTRKDNKSFLNE